jgi:hypothetical protein
LSDQLDGKLWIEFEETLFSQLITLVPSGFWLYGYMKYHWHNWLAGKIKRSNKEALLY